MEDGYEKKGANSRKEVPDPKVGVYMKKLTESVKCRVKESNLYQIKPVINQGGSGARLIYRARYTPGFMTANSASITELPLRKPT